MHLCAIMRRTPLSKLLTGLISSPRRVFKLGGDYKEIYIKSYSLLHIGSNYRDCLSL